MTVNSDSEQLKLYELITKDRISVRVEVEDWKQAIMKAGELLVQTGTCESKYITAMLRVKEELGPYIVIDKGVAVPHARPEDGVKKTAFSLVTLKNPVEFGNKENDPVDLVIAFGGIDNTSHIKALAQLAEILQNEEDTCLIRKAKTKKEVLKIIKKYKN